MDLPELPLRLVAPLAVGDALPGWPDARLEGSSSELGLQLRFSLPSALVVVEVEPLSPSRPAAARSRRFQFSYRTGDKQRPLAGDLGRGLCLAVAALAERNEAAVVAALREQREDSAPGPKLRLLEVERLLEQWGTLEERYYTLSPYVGCLIGCRFCYAQSRLGVLRDLQGLADVPWGSWVDVRVNAASVLREELRGAKDWAVKFCPIVSDPYHAVERKHRVTRACLEVLREVGGERAVVVLTRSSLVREDAALIASLPRGYAGMSVPTADDEIRKHFEPRGAPVEERFQTLAALKAAGARTFAIVQPLLPGDVAELAERLAECVSSVRIDVLRGTEGAAEEFADPRWPEAATEAWQVERAEQLGELLRARGVALWEGELPPGAGRQRRPGGAPAP